MTAAIITTFIMENITAILSTVNLKIIILKANIFKLALTKLDIGSQGNESQHSPCSFYLSSFDSSMCLEQLSWSDVVSSLIPTFE